VVTGFSGINSARQFDKSIRVLTPGKLKQGRFVHEALGLSYAKPPNCQEDLQSRIIRYQPHRMQLNKSPPMRLLFGEMAVINTIVLAPQTNEADSIPSVIHVELMLNRNPDETSFFREVRQREAYFASVPNIHIVRQMHRSKIAGMDVLEFEFIEQKQQLISRQVNLRAGRYLLGFSINAFRDDDLRLFDEMLTSIQIDSPTSNPSFGDGL
jgi:hypothetical protein